MHSQVGCIKFVVHVGNQFGLFQERYNLSEMTKIINESDKLNLQKGNQKGNHSSKYIDEYLLGTYVPRTRTIRKVNKNKTRNQTGSNND